MSFIADLWSYLVSLGTASILFMVVNWAVTMASGLVIVKLLWERENGMRAWLLLKNGVVMYLFGSLMAVVTLAAMQEKSPIESIIYVVLGAFCIYCLIAQDMHSRMKQAQESVFGVDHFGTLKYEPWLLVAAILVYVAGVLLPNLVVNSVTVTLLNVLLFVGNIPVISLGVSIVGGLVALGLVFFGLVMVVALPAMLFHRPKAHLASPGEAAGW